MSYLSYSGVVDGVNKNFTPSSPADVVYLNGLVQVAGTNFTFSSTMVVFLVAPPLGSSVMFYSFSALDSATTQSPSVAFPPRQIGDIANWVALKRLKRADLLENAVENAYNVYGLICSNIPFEALQITTPERPLLQGVTTYDLSDLNVAGIVTVRVNNGTRTQRLTRSHIRNYESQSARTPATNQMPSSYARWNYGIEMNPAPADSNGTYRLRIWQRPPVTTPLEATTIVTPPEWDELLRYETLYRTHLDNDEYDKAAQLVGGPPGSFPNAYPSQNKRRMKDGAIIPRLWNDLLMTISQREAGDEDFNFNRLVRRYT